MGRADILAGLAAVELIIKDAKFQKGLKDAQAKLRSFGKAVAITGGFIAAAGAAILAPIAMAVKRFIDFGSMLNDVSIRTGVGADALAEYAYAAEQTSTSLEAVELALKFMAKSGNRETLDEAAKRISAIEDPALRVAAAIKTWGKAGTAILPMARELASLRAEARALGIVFTPEQVAAADELGDAIGRIKTAVYAAAFQVGAALAPALTWLAAQVKYVAVAIGAFVRNNPQLTRIIAILGAAMVGIGTFLVAVGGGLVLLSAVVGGIAALGPVIAAIQAAIAALLTPLGAAIAAGVAIAAAIYAWIAALVAGVAAFLRFTKTGQAITRWFIEIAKVVAGFAIVVGVVLYKSLQLSWKALQSVWKVIKLLLTPAYELGRLFLKLGKIILDGVLWPINRLLIAFRAMGKAVGETFKMVIAAVKVGNFEAAWEIAMTGMEETWHRFAATVLDGLAVIAQQMLLLNLITGNAIPNAINAAAKSEYIDAEIARRKKLRLSKAAQSKAAGTDDQDRYGPPKRSAVAIGYNARSALMGRQIIGAGRNPVIDLLKAGLKLDAKAVKSLDTIERKMVVARFK